MPRKHMMCVVSVLVRDIVASWHAHSGQPNDETQWELLYTRHLRAGFSQCSDIRCDLSAAGRDHRGFLFTAAPFFLRADGVSPRVIFSCPGARGEHVGAAFLDGEASCRFVHRRSRWIHQRTFPFEVVYGLGRSRNLAITRENDSFWLCLTVSCLALRAPELVVNEGYAVMAKALGRHTNWHIVCMVAQTSDARVVYDRPNQLRCVGTIGIGNLRLLTVPSCCISAEGMRVSWSC